jgi:diguanylate cyclase (GGDEF)-like protein
MPENPSTIDRLRGLLQVTRLVRAETEQSALLEAIAKSVGTSLGFHTVVINLYRPAWNDFEVTTVHGSDDARRTLLGDTLDWAAWAPLLDERFERRGTYLIPHGAFDWEGDVGRRYVPDWEPSAEPDAWHPNDELFVPMLHSDGHMLGILSVGEPYTGTRPSDEELAVLVAVADHVALALQSFQEAAAAAHHRIALRELLQVSSRLVETPSVEAILHATCDGIAHALGFHKVAIQLPHPGTGVFTTRSTTGWTLDELGQNAPLAMWELAPLLDPPFEIEGCYLLTHEQAMSRLPAGHRMYRSVMNGRGPWAWDRHWLVVPLLDRDGKVIGVIWADDPDDRLVPSRQLMQALRVFANQATAALDSAGRFEEVRFLAEHDTLTRLLNRHAFALRLELEMTRSTRYGRPFTLVVLDVDEFKSVNDRHGHLAGDAALEQLGLVLRAGLRAADTAYRIGGDEFALLLPETSAAEARAVIERIAADLVAAGERAGTPLRASFGVIVGEAGLTDAEGLLREADAAMYEAKRTGAHIHFVA